MRINKTAIAALALCLSAAPGAFAQDTSTTQQNTGHAHITVAPKVEQISDTSAVVTWTTNAKTSSTVNYGTNRDNLDQTARSGWGGPEHKVTINNLKPNTTYFYQVMSTDAEGSGTGTLAKIETFQTKATVAGNTDSNTADTRDTRIVSGPRIENVTGNSATIKWTTNVQSSSTVRYGTKRNNLDKIARGGWGGPEHSVEIKGLEQGTNYFFQVISTDGFGSGTGALARISRFKTAGEQNAAAPDVPNLRIVNGPRVQSNNDTTAVVTWTTNVQSSSIVKYGTDQNNLDKMARAAWGGSDHSVTITGLQPGTSYYYEVVSGEGAGIGGSTVAKGQAFQTGSFDSQNAGMVKDQIQVQAGPIPQNVTDKAATLWWMTSGDTRTVVRYGTNKNQLDQTAQSTAGSEHKVTLNNLQPSTIYYFEVMSHDNLVRTTGQFQTEAANFAADAKKLRIINGPVVEYVSKDAAIVAWSTNVRASSVVRYGTDANNLNQTAQAPWGQETHRVRIANLKPNTPYFFVIESSQAEGTGTMAKSNPAPFVTVAEGAQALKTNFGSRR